MTRPAETDAPPCPDAGVIRDARARHRRRMRTSAAASVGVMLVAAGAAGLAGHSHSKEARHPTAAKLAGLNHQVAGAEERCLMRLPAPAEIGPAPHAPRVPSAQATVGFWHAALTDRQGPATMLLFEADGGRARETCYVGPSRNSEIGGGGYRTQPLPPLAAAALSEVASGHGRTQRSEGSKVVSWIDGRVGAAVATLTIRFADGGHATAHVAHGWFLAWWHGQQPLAHSHAIVTQITAPRATHATVQ